MPYSEGNMIPEDTEEIRKGLEEDGGFVANFLKSMIPAATRGNANSANSVPSISSDSESRRRNKFNRIHIIRNIFVCMYCFDKNWPKKIADAPLPTERPHGS
jgi:hypothetical protein